MLDIALPDNAKKLAVDCMALPVIQVVDDRTNIAACENLKIVKKTFKEFESACEPTRLELRKPLDSFLLLKKQVSDLVEAWEKNQKHEIGLYNKKIMEQENARLLSENSYKVIEQSKAKSSFVSMSSKLVAKGQIIDKCQFIAAVMGSGNYSWINLIFKEVNESKLNEFLKAMEIDGTKKTFPGVFVELVPEVKVR